MECLSEIDDEIVCVRDLGNRGTLSKKAEKDNQGKGNCDAKSETSSVGKFETEFPLVNINKLESANEETLRKPGNSRDEPDSDPLKNSENDKLNLGEHFGKGFWLTVSPRREIFPKINEENNQVYKLPQFRCSFVEHNYCQVGKFGLELRKIKIRKSTCLKAQSENTFKFENASESGKKIMEQQTIDVGNSITTNHVDSNLRESNSVKERLNKTVSKTNNSNINGAANVTDTHGKNKPVKSLTPKIRIRKSSKGSGDYYDIIVGDGASMPPPFLAVKCDSSEIKNLSKKLKKQDSDLKAKRKLESDKEGIDSDNIANEVSEMEKIVESGSEALFNSVEKHPENVGSKNNEVPALKISNLSSKEDVSESQNEGEFVLSKATITKTMPEDKNWNLEYTEDDVKNLGLDDLLLRASELNAENFTKALGQNSGGRNGNKNDSPDIVLSFPASKRESDDPLDGDNSKGGSVKKAKLEFLKKCVLDDNFMKSIEEESLKKIPEAPKRPGIKVKTVQNINEEFKDSLGAKLKKFEGRDVAPESSIPVFTVNDDMPKCNQTKEVFFPDKVAEKQSALLSCRKVNKQQDPTKNIDEISEETRPFIMTIIQNKDNPAKDHMPAALTPKVFIKPKPVFSDHGTFLPTIEGRKGDSANNKIPEGRDSCSKSDDNVTLVVSEPRSFEVVNVDEYSDPKVKKTGINSHFVLNYGSLAKKDLDGKNLMHGTLDAGARKKNIPILLSSKKKYLRMPLVNSQKLLISPAEDPNKRINSGSRPQTRVVNSSPEGTANIQRENSSGEKPTLTISSIDQRVITKDARSGTGGGKCVQVISNMVSPRSAKVTKNSSQAQGKANSEVEKDHVPRPRSQMMSLTAFANILKDILPEKWILSLDKQFGLQMIKTHLDEYLNPSIMISVVVGRTGKVTVNVRGRQLEQSHDLFSNLCDVGNSNEKISINYILAIMNRLRFYNVCFGCDDLSLKKYWSEDGFIEYYTEFQQTYRSHICESLVRLGRKRCHPCYRMHESLKKRRRREQLTKKTESDSNAKTTETGGSGNYPTTNQGKGVKRNLEEYLEESFMHMKQRIRDEIERAKEEEENEKVPKTQDEVLGFMGLTRKESLDVNLRKSKRERKGYKKCESLLTTHVNKEELYFLEKYWHEINILFSTSLLVGAYSRTSMAKLKEKCKTFYKLLATWREIVRDNAIWVGGYINLAENLVNDEEMVNSESVKKKFDRMDVTALRAYIINCVKEVNRMKNRLRTKNRYFRVLYNTFLKPNMKKAKQAAEMVGSSNANVELAAEKNSAQESTPEKLEELKRSTSTEIESSDENSHHGGGAAPCASDGD